MPEPSSSPTFWESYRNGVGLGLGLATVYLLVLLLVGLAVARWGVPKIPPQTEPGQPQLQPGKGAQCLAHWQT